jgi:hypothetical protein
MVLYSETKFNEYKSVYPIEKGVKEKRRALCPTISAGTLGSRLQERDSGKLE